MDWSSILTALIGGGVVLVGHLLAQARHNRDREIGDAQRRGQLEAELEVLRGLAKTTAAEVTNNSGSSMKDAVTRVEEKVDRIGSDMRRHDAEIAGIRRDIEHLAAVDEAVRRRANDDHSTIHTRLDQIERRNR